MSEPSMAGQILGVNTRHYPTQVPGTDGWNFEPPAVRAVLVSGEIGDYACYIGLGEPEWVARHGDKLRFQEAQCHFPSITSENYRE